VAIPYHFSARVVSSLFTSARPAEVADYSEQARSVLVFEVPDLEAALENLRSHKVTILHSTPGENESGRYAAFADPFGIVHEVFEPRSNRSAKLR
jgi:uncharacterized glyoxalase superfamily protein PhnB